MSDSRFAGKVAIVTGAASGIGLATAKAFAREGAKLVLADIDDVKLRLAVESIASTGATAVSVVTDISDPDACERMVAHAVTTYGHLDIAVNNAGIPTPIGGEFEATPVELWRRVIDVNLSGVFWSMRAETPALKAAGGGAIVNTASVASVIAAPGMAAYVAAKHGVAGLTRAASLDLIRHGIRVNAVCPGFVDTNMLAPLTADPVAASQAAATTPIGRFSQPGEIAAAILFLCSDAASYSVGQLMVLDGGATIQ